MCRRNVPNITPAKMAIQILLLQPVFGMGVVGLDLKGVLMFFFWILCIGAIIVLGGCVFFLYRACKEYKEATRSDQSSPSSIYVIRADEEQALGAVSG